MPLLISSQSVNSLIDYFVHNDNNNVHLVHRLRLTQTYIRNRCKSTFNLQLFATIYSFLFFESKAARRENAAQCTIITIEADENTPLLPLSWGARQKLERGRSASCRYSVNQATRFKFCESRLVAIAAVLVTGFLIATYLLIAESRVPSVRFSLDLINRDVWCKINIPLGNPLNHSNVVNIVIVQTYTDDCTSPENCVKLLQAMQNANTLKAEEIPYNFVVGSDGQAYEVRGWDHESGFSLIPQISSIVIGLTGNFTINAPSEVQLHSTYSLINESLRRKKLQRSYRIIGLRNRTVSQSDGAALFKIVSKWPRFGKLLDVF